MGAGSSTRCNPIPILPSLSSGGNHCEDTPSPSGGRLGWGWVQYIDNTHMKKLTTQQVTRSRKLRGTLTDAEQLLWHHLRQKQVAGIKFRRQHPVGRYVVDFVCLANRLAIEVDGGQHAEMKLQDRQRDAFLAQEGFRVLRFWNNEVLGNIDGVMESIWAAVAER